VIVVAFKGFNWMQLVQPRRGVANLTRRERRREHVSTASVHAFLVNGYKRGGGERGDAARCRGTNWIRKSEI
jgi:hypothetical protein